MAEFNNQCFLKKEVILEFFKSQKWGEKKRVKIIEFVYLVVLFVEPRT
jgi:hypothetical protein